MNAGDSSSSIFSSSSILEMPFIYGTAWKEDETKRLTRLAIEQGVRGIDTANQRKHYREAAVGEAIKDAIRDGIVFRDALFLQTQFTFQSEHAHLSQNICGRISVRSDSNRIMTKSK